MKKIKTIIGLAREYSVHLVVEEEILELKCLQSRKLCVQLKSQIPSKFISILYLVNNKKY